MAFLQLKKSTHIDKTFSFQLIVNPITVDGTMNRFNTMEYEIPVTNIGDNYSAEKWNESDPITFKKGDNLYLKCTAVLYGKLVDFSMGELVDVTMASKEGDGVMWKVQMSSKTWDKPVANDSSKAITSAPSNESTSTQDNIRYGMAFNNATKIACSMDGLSSAEKVEVIRNIMLDMWDIASSIDDVMQKHQPVVTEPVAKEESSDDLPF